MLEAYSEVRMPSTGSELNSYDMTKQVQFDIMKQNFNTINYFDRFTESNVFLTQVHRMI